MPCAKVDTVVEVENSFDDFVIRLQRYVSLPETSMDEDAALVKRPCHADTIKRERQEGGPLNIINRHRY